MRLMECIRLRVKEMDSDHLEITVRDGRSGKDRITTLPLHRCTIKKASQADSIADAYRHP